MPGWRQVVLEERTTEVPFGHYFFGSAAEPLTVCSWCGARVWVVRDTRVTFCEDCDHLRAIPM